MSRCARVGRSTPERVEAAEDAARELPNLPLEDALQHAERGSPKYERAALRWLERCLAEGDPRLAHVAELGADLAAREPDTR